MMPSTEYSKSSAVFGHLLITTSGEPQSVTQPSCLYIFEVQHDETYILTYVPNEEPAHPHSLIRVFVVRMKKVASVAVQNSPSSDSDRLCECVQAYLNLRWAQRFEGTSFILRII